MYSKFFNLTNNPFAETPDPTHYFRSEEHVSALKKLARALTQGKGFIQLTGEIGTGKTTLSRYLIKNCEGVANFALILRPQHEGRDLIALLAEEFGLHNNPQYSQSSDLAKLAYFFFNTSKMGKKNIIIIDEAQVLSLNAMETIRLLSNVECETKKLVQVVFIGQPELETKLNTYAYRQINQRISLRIKLGPLRSQETGKYIKHRLDVANGANFIGLDDKAINYIHKRSLGIPRLINLFCQSVISYAEKEEKRFIYCDLVKKALKEDGLHFKIHFYFKKDSHTETILGI